jgi:endoglucanase
VVSNEWNTGLTGVIRITNNGTSAINGWNLSWSYSDGTKLTNSWNANVSGSNPYSATDLGWNGTVQPGQSVEFGFQANKGTSASAQIPVVTGSVCH